MELQSAGAITGDVEAGPWTLSGGVTITGPTNLGTLTLPTPDHINVSVVDSSGSPVPDATLGVDLYSDGPNSWCTRRADGRSYAHIH